MHDLTYAQNIISVLKDKLRGKGAETRVAVNVVLGPFTHVTDASLRAAFQTLAEKENLKNIDIKVEKEKVSVKCAKCLKITKSEKPVFSCPECGAEQLDLLNTEEFLIQSIEIEE